MLVADCAGLQPQSKIRGELKRHMSRGLLDTSGTPSGQSMALSIYWCKLSFSIITYRYFLNYPGAKIYIILDCIRKCFLDIGPLPPSLCATTCTTTSAITTTPGTTATPGTTPVSRSDMSFLRCWSGKITSLANPAGMKLALGLLFVAYSLSFTSSMLPCSASRRPALIRWPVVWAGEVHRSASWSKM